MNLVFRKENLISPENLLPLKKLIPPENVISPGKPIFPEICKIKTKSLRFNNVVTISETYSKSDYDRTTRPAPSITPIMAFFIRRELNELKAEMEVHNESQVYTHFYH